jgi:hypothetical protein
MAKLLCPQCKAKVTIGDDIIARHPVVRCSKCQQAIPVATSRISEQSLKQPRKLKRKSTFPTGMVVGVGLGLFMLLAAIITLVVLLGRGDLQQARDTQAGQLVTQDKSNPLQPFQPQSPTRDNRPTQDGPVTRESLMKLADQRDAIFDQMVTVMENLRTEADAEPAIEKLTKLFPEYNRLVKELKEKASDLPTEVFPEFIGEMTERTMKSMQKTDRRLDIAAERIKINSALVKKLRQLGMTNYHLGDQGIFHKQQ